MLHIGRALPPESLAFLGMDGDGRGRQEPAKDKNARASGSRAHRTILVVEDSEQDMILLRAACETSSVHAGLQWVRSAEDARAYFEGRGLYADRTRHPLPDLVLLDLQLGAEDGFAVLGWLRTQAASWHRVPVIVLTTSQAREEIAKAYELGANSFLTKPTDFNGTCRLVGNVAEYWLDHNRG